MGIRVQQALLSSLLIAALFSAPYLQTVRADEQVASSTEEFVVEEVASSTDEALVEDVAPTSEEVIPDSGAAPESDPANTDEPETASAEESATLPTGVLFDNSYSDQDWNIDIHNHGHYVYLFRGYEEIANPPVLSNSTSWITTGTTTSARLKRAGDTTCDRIAFGGTQGLILFGPNFEYYGTSYSPTPTSGDEYCDFVFRDGVIPPGTPLSMAVIGVNGTSTIAGSSLNPGTSLDGSNSDPVAGGFAFQLCGLDGCSGGFGTPPPPEPEGPKLSNVLFLPGIKGSRLYESGNECDPDIDGCSVNLWVPSGDANVRELFLNAIGQSEHEVYAREGQIIDTAGGQKFYASFIDDMNAKDASDEYGTSWTWRPVAYDWRLSLPDIVNKGAKHRDRIYYDQATSTPYIEQTLRELAHTSSTGKVTIVAHSNGGLVTKALLQKLGDVQTAELVDKIIFVGVPQSGAPQAIGGLLFGYAEGLPGKGFIPDFIMTKAVARELAVNSPMAYHLLPSYAYLRDTQDPTHSIISFTGSHLYQEEQNRYGPTVDTIEELDDFLLARDGGRTQPAYSDLTIANILNAGLITYANTTHDSIDSWVPPTGVTLYQIAGWGADTISGVDFYDEKKLLGTTIGYKRQYRPVFVEDGDGVVPVPSALMTDVATNVHNYWLNLKAISEQLRVNYGHGDLFEATALRAFIESKIQSIDSPSQFVFSNQPGETSQSKKLIFQLHSPLTLGIYDASGNYTGLNTDGSVSENVSGAQYGEFGDVKYLIAPAGQEYTLTLHGQSAGTFSLDIQEQTGNTVTTSTTIADVPTTAQTTASLTITNSVADASSLTVDENGDGSTDIELTPVTGETTTYTAPVAEVTDTSSGTSSGSKSTSHSTTEAVTVTVADTATVTVTAAPTATQIEAVTQTEPSIQSQTLAFEGEASVVPSPSPKEDRTQTASVYDAFTPLAELIKSLLYNLWQGTLALLKYFLL